MITMHGALLTLMLQPWCGGPLAPDVTEHVKQGVAALGTMLHGKVLSQLDEALGVPLPRVARFQKGGVATASEGSHSENILSMAQSGDGRLKPGDTPPASPSRGDLWVLLPSCRLCSHAHGI